MRSKHSTTSLSVLVSFLIAGTISAQDVRPTIPEVLTGEGKSLGGFMTVPSGPTPTLTEILGDADTVVRGIVGESRSYLSDDQRDVYTDYSILNPIFLYQAEMVTSTRPGVMPTVTVTLLGGTIKFNGLTYTSQVMALPPLEPGTECLFLLKRIGDKYRIAGTFYGAFRVAASKLVPLTRKEGFASEYHEMPAIQATEDIVALLRALRR